MESDERDEDEPGGEPVQLLPEEELYGALASERPDPAAFRAGVERRLAERAGRAEASAPPDAGPLRWAAGVLPPGLLPMALGPGIAVGKKLGLKAVPGLMALPAVSLAMVALTFLGGLRSLRALRGGEAVEGDPRGVLLRAWWARHRTGAGVSLVVVFLLLATGHPEAVMVLLLVSMLGILLVVAELSRAGLATRNRVAAVLAALLWWMTFYGWVFAGMFDREAREGAGHVFLALLAAGVACNLLALRGLPRLPFGEHFHARAPEVGRIRLQSIGFLVGYAFLGLLLVSSTFLGPGQRAPRFVDLESWAQDFDAGVEKLGAWWTIDRVGRWLRAEGRLPDLSQARLELDRARRDGVDLHYRVTSAALALDLADDDLVRAEAEEAYRFGHLFAGQGRVTFLASRSVDLRAALRVRPPTEAQRRTVTRRLLATWPEEEDAHDSLELMLEVTELLELLGRADLLEERRDDVRDALIARWIGSYHEGPAGFEGRAEYARKEHANGSDVPTYVAIELMRHFGVPPEIDLWRVREHLVDEHRIPYRRPVLSLALEILDGELPVTPPAPPTFGQRLLRERLTIAALLLGLLCVAAALRAPPGIVGEEVDA